MTVFRFVLLTLAAFRLTRLVVSDAWPPTKWLREKIESRTGSDSGWTMLTTCPWCFGVWVTFAVFLVDHFIWSPPIYLLAPVAASALVGLLGTYDER